MEHLTIGQMAALNHISEQTLRLYDKLGLLSPAVRQEETRYRYYDVTQSARLDMIQYMKSLGMSLADIKTQLDAKNLPLVKRILSQKSRQIDTQISELKHQKRAIERTIESFDRYESAPPDGSMMMEYIAPRLLYCYDAKINFYEYGIEAYEKMLRQLKMSLVANSLPQIYFCNAGSILRRENLQKRRLYSTEVFVFVDKEYVKDSLTCPIAGGMYLCIYCDKFDKEPAYMARLLDEIAAKNYTISGDYICEVLTDFPVFGSSTREMFLRLQIPVKFTETR
ncbi:MAG: MerR family transcriptional regulator [Ruthenibacterium sp.]